MTLNGFAQAGTMQLREGTEWMASNHLLWSANLELLLHDDSMGVVVEPNQFVFEFWILDLE